MMAVVCSLDLVDLFKVSEPLSTQRLNSKPTMLLSSFGGLHSPEGPNKYRLALGEFLHRSILL